MWKVITVIILVIAAIPLTFSATVIMLAILNLAGIETGALSF